MQLETFFSEDVDMNSSDVKTFVTSLVSELEQSLKREAALELECEKLRTRIAGMNIKMERLIINRISGIDSRSGLERRYSWS
jgi:regulator of replication initiation timing